MTDTRHEQPRCAICGRIQRPAWCGPTACYFGPLHALVPKDVDAEVAPKGLQVLTLTEPVWADNWYPNRHGYERTLISIRASIPPQTRTVLVGRGQDGLWGYYAGRVGNTDVYAANHPTPEAAQAACEAAIIAAWRNR